MLRLRPCSLVAALALLGAGCDRGVGPNVRTLEVHGLPRCAARSRYARPIVVRVDRERALFDEPYRTQQQVEVPTSPVALSVPRARMRLTVRAGLCAPTSLATWDCAAATWLSQAVVDVDGRATPLPVTLPEFEVPCTVQPR